jgi:hypothetical protein
LRSNFACDTAAAILTTTRRAAGRDDAPLVALPRSANCCGRPGQSGAGCAASAVSTLRRWRWRRLQFAGAWMRRAIGCEGLRVANGAAARERRSNSQAGTAATSDFSRSQSSARSRSSEASNHCSKLLLSMSPQTQSLIDHSTIGPPIFQSSPRTATLIKPQPSTRHGHTSSALKTLRFALRASSFPSSSRPRPAAKKAAPTIAVPQLRSCMACARDHGSSGLARAKQAHDGILRLIELITCEVSAPRRGAAAGVHRVRQQKGDNVVTR